MKVIASVGVVLCLAMTSFAIYLGIAEHVYAPHASYAPAALVFYTPNGRSETCARSSKVTTTTSDVTAQVTSCTSSTHHGS